MNGTTFRVGTLALSLIAVLMMVAVRGTYAAPAAQTVDGYIDNRSGPVEVLQSLYNAVNRHEYARAYSYWQKAPSTFAQFQQGYATTQSVQLTTGNVSSDAGASNYYYQVPVALKAQTTTGATQTFVGCYTLHLASPAAQATPPFQPLGIVSAKMQQVPNSANIGVLLNQSCH